MSENSVSVPEGYVYHPEYEGDKGSVIFKKSRFNVPKSIFVAPVVLSADSGLTANQLYASYLKSPDFASECKTKPNLDKIPSVSDGLGGVFGDFILVGHGKQTSNSCSYFRDLKACLHTELHHNTLDGANHEGKAYVKIFHTWCHNAQCPICYKHGYAVREANCAFERIKEAEKTHDSKAEHIIYGISPIYYNLSFEQLRSMARKDLMANGIIGGALIFHGFRYLKSQYIRGRIARMANWYWSPHFHCVGFIKGGYAHCRNCKKVKNSALGNPSETICRGCSGFENKVRKYYEKHQCIIKVIRGVRQTIHGTFWYQLNHASIDVTKKRFHAITWFGSCGYHKLHVEHQKHENLCPYCKHELVKVRYFGSVTINTDFNSSLFKRELWLDAFEDGKPVFAVIDDNKGFG